MLTNDELEKYSRHFLIDEWDEDVQLKLKGMSVFIAGAGGLGSPVALYLASAGFGHVVLCDMDTVEMSNLNRQILYHSDDIGHPKSIRGAERLRLVNSSIEVTALNRDVESAEEIISGCDIIMDCLDNFSSRLFLNRTAVKLGKPLFHGGVSQFYGQVTTIIPGQTPCLNCFIDEKTSPSSKGITGAMAGIIGSIQSVEAIKYASGIGSLLAGKLLYTDFKSMNFSIMKLAKKTNCRTCSGIKTGE